MNAAMPLSEDAIRAMTDAELLGRFESLVSDSREWRVSEEVIGQCRDEILRRMSLVWKGKP